MPPPSSRSHWAAKFQAGNGFNVVAAHTDSPCLKLKPVTASKKSGFLKVGVQTYGGGLWYTWFDRDLSVAGRVLIREADGTITDRLVCVRRPIMRIPTLAIHLDRNVNTDGFKPNFETHLAPVLATQVKAAMEQPTKQGKGKEGKEAKQAKEGKQAKEDIKEPHHALLLSVLAEELGCAVTAIVDFELNVCDTQPSTVAGAASEFIFSGRLDNLAMSFCALKV